MQGSEFLIPIALFIVVAAIVKIVTDNRTRQKLIDKGLVDENVKYLFANKLEYTAPSSLKWGMVLVGVGLAILIGQMLPRRISEEVTIGAIFMFAGLGLLLYYFIASRMVKKSEEENIEK